jgi:phosphoglucosamine mutase
MIFFDHNTTGDGTLSALQMLAIMQRTGKPLSELAKVMTALPQILRNVRVKEKVELATIPEVQQVIEHCEAELGQSGRILIRYSGTEPLLRIMLEGESTSEIEQLAEQIVSVVETHLSGVREEA